MKAKKPCRLLKRHGFSIYISLNLATIVSSSFRFENVCVKRAAARADSCSEQSAASAAGECADQSAAARADSKVNQIAMPLVKSRALVNVITRRISSISGVVITIPISAVTIDVSVRVSSARITISSPAAALRICRERHGDQQNKEDDESCQKLFHFSCTFLLIRFQNWERNMLSFWESKKSES